MLHAYHLLGFKIISSKFIGVKNKLAWILSLLAVLCVTIYSFRLEALGWYFWHGYKHQDPAHTQSLDLKSYQVEIDGLAIPDLENASGFTYNLKRNTLFTVLNKESQIVEIDLKGKVIRKIHVTGVDDMEGITHIADSRYVIADERDNRLVLVTLDDDVAELNIENSPMLKLGLNPAGNKNFEGVSWDDNNSRLLVVKERDPMYIMSVKGFFDAKAGQPLNIVINKIEDFDSAFKWSLRDLSSVTYHSKTGHLLLLSDESRLIKEYDEAGNALGALALWKGFHGLHQHVPQAEGIAVGEDGRIYVMSEPNLFYVFKPSSSKPHN